MYELRGTDEGGALSWQERALCAQTDPEAFFPEKGGSTREAKKVCLSCEVRGECLEYAFCDAGTCKRRAIEGEACMDDGNCLGTLRCDEMVCRMRPSNEVCAF